MGFKYNGGVYTPEWGKEYICFAIAGVRGLEP
jgi:hypothetical protein